MTTGATGQLGLALPVQGELSGTWGDTVNNGITQYTNIAIAATLTLTNDGAVTLANTTGDASASNITSSLTGAGTVTAQFAIVKVTGTLTTTKVVTGPSYSKTYVVVNAATGGTVTFKASGQTGVSIAVGESAWVYYNGTDYVKIAGTTSGAAGGSTTQVQYNSSGSLAGSSNLTFDGTSLTLGGNPTLSAGTANGVTYLNGSKVLTSGSALTFDGTDLLLASGGLLDIDSTNAAVAMRIRQTTAGAGTEFNTTITENTGVTFDCTDGGATARSFIWTQVGSEQMRLTSTGLGIGTSSPGDKLQVGSGNSSVKIGANGANNFQIYNGALTQDGTNYAFAQNYTGQNTQVNAATGGQILLQIASSTKATLDSSGNLGLGVTPSAWYSPSTWRAMQVGCGSIFANLTTSDSRYIANGYLDSSGTYRYINSAGASFYGQAAGAHTWNTAASGTAGNAISFTQAMTLNASGYLGIGETSPAAPLDIKTANSAARFNSSDANGVYATFSVNGTPKGYIGTAYQIVTSGSKDDFAVQAVNNFVFATGGSTERARIDSSGNLLVGTTTAAAKLTIASTTNPALTLPNIAEIATVSATAATGTINYDLTTQSVLYYTTNASGNFTMNIRGNSGLSLNSMMSTGQSVTMAFLCTNGSTAYYQSAMTIDGTSVTPKWQGGTAPTTGNASAIDSYVYTIIKTASATFTVLASQTKFA